MFSPYPSIYKNSRYDDSIGGVDAVQETGSAGRHQERLNCRGKFQWAWGRTALIKQTGGKWRKATARKAAPQRLQKHEHVCNGTRGNGMCCRRPERHSISRASSQEQSFVGMGIRARYAGRPAPKDAPRQMNSGDRWRLNRLPLFLRTEAVRSRIPSLAFPFAARNSPLARGVGRFLHSIAALFAAPRSADRLSV